MANTRAGFRLYISSFGRGFWETKGDRQHRLVHLIVNSWLGHVLFVFVNSYDFARIDQAYIQSGTQKRYLLPFYIQKTFPFARTRPRHGHSYKVMFFGLFLRRSGDDCRLMVCEKDGAGASAAAHIMVITQDELQGSSRLDGTADAHILGGFQAAPWTEALQSLRPKMVHFFAKRRRSAADNAALALIFASQKLNFNFVRRQVLHAQNDPLGTDHGPRRDLESELNALINPYFMGPHNYSRRLATLTEVELKTGLDEIFAFLQARGFEAFLNSGTLLGATRSGDLLPHDDDMDLAVYIPGADIAEVALKWQNLRTEMAQAFDFQLKGAFAALYLESDIQVDVFPAWIAENKVYIFPYCFGAVDAADIFPLKTGTLRGIAFPVPANVEKVLTVNYGPNWREPDPYWKFDWMLAAKKFKVSRKYLISK